MKKRTILISFLIIVILAVIFIIAKNLLDKKVDKNDETASIEVDIDLTKLNSNMTYAQVFDMMNYPTNYLGKTIKAKGQYQYEYLQDTGKYYHYVVVKDAMGCCSQGLEFIWEGEHTFPDDYPKKIQTITIVGTFSSYSELGQTFFYLSVENM